MKACAFERLLQQADLTEAETEVHVLAGGYGEGAVEASYLIERRSPDQAVGRDEVNRSSLFFALNHMRGIRISWLS